MKFTHKIPALTLIAEVLIVCGHVGGATDGCKIVFEKDGSVNLESSLLAVTASSFLGQDDGLSKWFFKPTGFEMIDVLYGQTDYVKGHILGERWDPVEAGSVLSGVPFAARTLYVPIAHATSKDGRFGYLVQEASGGYRWRRTIIFRRDSSVLELRYELENVSSATQGFALRFHSALNPGARGKYKRTDDLVFVPLKDSVLGLDQSLSNEKYTNKYLDDKFFLPCWDKEPPRLWVMGKMKTPPLSGNWVAQVNQGNGDGMAFIIDKESLVGFYNCPGTTIEPVLKAITLNKGETWSARCFTAAFSGAKGGVVENANPVYVASQPFSNNGGKLSGKVIPLFKGTLRMVDGNGKQIYSGAADPTKVTSIVADTDDKSWKMIALDSQGQEIGNIDSDGKVVLHEEEIKVVRDQNPSVKADVFVQDDSEKKIKDFINDRDFTVYCAWSDIEEVKEAAQKIAHILGVGLANKNPGGKLLVVGKARDELIHDIGLMKNSVSTDWPGAGKGAILHYDNLEFTRNPALLVCGSDSKGALNAELYLIEKYLRGINVPTGFAFRPVGVECRVFPYSRILPSQEKIAVKAARGEYEPAQVVITAFEDLSSVKVTVAPLISATSGKEIAKNYLTNYRKQRGPIWVRWVNYYPVDQKDGSTGYPDPLLERAETNIQADRSQSLWLTFIIPENAEPGLYASSITCTTNKGMTKIPIEVTVWDFNLPLDGLRGEPYINFSTFTPSEERELRSQHIERLVTDMVEHGMRVIQLSVAPTDLFQWHFSKDGKLQDMGLNYMETSADGTVALDARGVDWLVNECDRFAKPFDVSYLIYIQSVLGKGSFASYAEFKDTFPDRFKGKPQRDGHYYQDYYVEEMIGLIKKHLEKKGWLNRFIMKVGDEPPGFDWWNDRFTKAVKGAGMPYSTCFSSIDWKDAEKGLGELRRWQPLYQNYNAEFFKKAKASGALVSWYNCGPPPKIVTENMSELRGYVWQGAKADLDSIAWWGIQCWGSEGSGTGKDLWQNRYAHWNTVVYPEHPYKPSFQMAERGTVDLAPIDGIRWEMIREGMEDAWYVNLLRKEIVLAEKDGRTEVAKTAQAELYKIWKDVFPTLNDYKPPYDIILKCREKLAEQILILKKSKIP